MECSDFAEEDGDMDRSIVTSQNIKKNVAMDISARKMRELSHCTEVLGDLDDQSIQGDCEDQVERDPNYVEDRFRVDRRKLEQMLQGEILQICLPSQWEN